MYHTHHYPRVIALLLRPDETLHLGYPVHVQRLLLVHVKLGDVIRQHVVHAPGLEVPVELLLHRLVQLIVVGARVGRGE